MATQMAAYPLRFHIQYPAKLSRGLIFVKWVLAIPHFLNVYALNNLQGMITLVAFFAILFTRKFPPGLFDLYVKAGRWAVNVTAYAWLFRDEYPPFSLDVGQYPYATYEVDYPPQLSAWLIFVKWFLAIPHYIVLGVLWFVGFFAWIIAWFAILFTEQFPRGLFDFLVGLLRWGYRVQAYTLLLRDEYPPFSLG